MASGPSAAVVGLMEPAFRRYADPSSDSAPEQLTTNKSGLAINNQALWIHHINVLIDRNTSVINE